MYRFKITDGATTLSPVIDLDITPGETLVLLMPDNNGRALLLHRMAGLSDQGLSDWKGIAPAISHMLQQPLLLPWRSVQENMLMVNDDEQLVDHTIKLTGLESFRSTRSSTLQPAALRRAMLARCLLNIPDLIVIDDPVFDLVGDEADNLRGLIRELVIDNPERTLVYGTADYDEACSLGGRVVVLSDQPLRVERELFNPTPVELLA